MSFLLWPLKLLLALPVILACLLTLSAVLMADQGWLWGLTAHFRVQYLAIQMLALLITGTGYWLARKQNKMQPGKWLTMVILLFFAGLNLVPLLPYYLPMHRPDRVQVANRQSITLMHMNLFGKLNPHTDKVVQAITETNPDLLVLVEYTTSWVARLERSGVLRAYPHRMVKQGQIGMYSKRPLSEARIFYTDPAQRNSSHANIQARITLNGEPVTVLAAHPASPDRPDHLVWQQQSFRYWTQHRLQMGKNLIIAGDLNTTPWSHEFETLTRRTGLRDSQLGYGLQPSWPMFNPHPSFPHEPNLGAQALRIPIDHVLVSERLMVLSRRLGPFTGSDHLPVIVTLALQGK